ncbi:DUF4861 family protein [Pedobacter sp. SL55]|uniref:DUF4861 family protein n=1 Tax=Pedobacter sp. SL55 TaxID=2995161 RepID=UPI00226F7E4A|nr:DUF4861 family protein [Pedobacter sp. SL55]WAC41142.1 DUF4861 family protein [Pedobacter sp. SL55]
MRFLFLILALSSTLSYAQQPLVTVTVENPSHLPRKNEIVEISWRKILARYPKIDTANFKVLNAATNAEIPYQLEMHGHPIHQLLLQVSLAPKEVITLNVVAGKPKAITPKTYARYVPERKDDFAWENDKVAFRLYGKALEGTADDAQGLDIWAKRTEKLIVNKWYKSGDYHTDHGDGLDYYSVGMTLGAGDIAPFANGKIIYPKHYRKYEVLDNGPLRSSFMLDFDAVDVAGEMIKLRKKYTLDAGSRLNKVEIILLDSDNQQQKMAIGLVTVKQPNGNKYMNAKEGISYYWQKTDPKNGTIGVAALTSKSFEQVFESEGQILNLLTLASQKPIVYYNGGVWDKQGEIKTEQEWLAYLRDFKQKLAKPLKVKVK